MKKEEIINKYKNYRNFVEYEDMKAKFQTKFATSCCHNGEIVDVIGKIIGKDVYSHRYVVLFQDGTIEDNILSTELEFDYED